MDDPALLPIGMFSRASQLSIKTLRAHHESGLLVPASVDPRTGYRAYSVDQLADAAVIVRLRALDLPLEQVREVLAHRDPEHTRRVLAAHQVTMARRLADTERILAELRSGGAPGTHTPVHVRDEPARHTLRVRATVPDHEFPAFLGHAFARLAALAGATGAVVDGPCGGLYPPEIEDDGAQPAEAFVPVADPVRLPAGEREVALGEVPAARVAVLVHAGDYADIGDTYRTLGAWVARNASPGPGPIREWYVVGPPEATDPRAYRTEIAWPLAAEG